MLRWVFIVKMAKTFNFTGQNWEAGQNFSKLFLGENLTERWDNKRRERNNWKGCVFFFFSLGHFKDKGRGAGSLSAAVICCLLLLSYWEWHWHDYGETNPIRHMAGVHWASPAERGCVFWRKREKDDLISYSFIYQRCFHLPAFNAISIGGWICLMKSKWSF